jgi:hypothetical protein
MYSPTVMPAFWHCSMARGTSGRSGSSIPTAATSVRPSSAAATSRLAQRASNPRGHSLYATIMTRRPSSAQPSATARSASQSRGSEVTPSAASRDVALQVEFERQTLKPVFSLDGL